MKKYMDEYEIKSIEENFTNNFFLAEYLSYISFKKYMFSSYYSFITDLPRVERFRFHNCIRNNIIDSTYKTKRIISHRRTEFEWVPDATYEDFTNIYSDLYFIENFKRCQTRGLNLI